MKNALNFAMIAVVLTLVLGPETSILSLKGKEASLQTRGLSSGSASYEARQWDEVMTMPSEDQIRSAAGSIRSPYVAFYTSYPGVSRIIECSTDVHADHDPKGTYICPMNWWMNVSGLESRYERVYNDYTGTPGGYCGLQRLEDGSGIFIMTVWTTFCQDSNGNVTVFTPRVTYPEGKGRGNIGNAEGSFVQCLLPFEWETGRDYRFLLQQSVSGTTGCVTLDVWICDLQEGRWTRMAQFDTGLNGIWIDSVGGFLENFLTDHAGEVRSMELTNFRARSWDSASWTPADSVRVLLNGSVTDPGYRGSASYGTDGASFYAVTSGVPRLCPDQQADMTFVLNRGETGCPY